MTVTEALVSIVALGTCVGLPMLGMVLRFSVKPLVEARRGLAAPDVEDLRQRVAALEALLEQHMLAPTLYEAPLLNVPARQRS